MIETCERQMFHSQPETAQDEWVIWQLKAKHNGFFIEIGAFDGVYHSNTLVLERDFGWDGILIEANMNAAMKASKARKAKIIVGVVSDTGGWQPFYHAAQWSGLQAFTRPNLRAAHDDVPQSCRPTFYHHIAGAAETLQRAGDR